MVVPQMQSCQTGHNLEAIRQIVEDIDQQRIDSLQIPLQMATAPDWGNLEE